MKSILKITLVSALSALSCFGDPKADVKAAAEKLAAAPNYSWTTETEIAGGQFTPQPINGKIDKAGFAVVTQEREGVTTMAVLKGENGVVKSDGAWKTGEELRADGQGGGRFRAGMLLRSRSPAEEALKALEGVKELKAADGVISGDLTESSAKELQRFGGRNSPFPDPTNAKGSVKFWVKDGQLAKLQLKLSGTFSFNGQERDIERTTTYQVKDVGSTMVEVPEEARKKLGS